MAFHSHGTELPGVVASADLSAGQFRAIVIDSSGEVALAGADVAVDGFLQNKPDAQGKSASVWGPGSITKAVVGTGGATAGTYAVNAADGVTDAVATDLIVGKFLETGVAGTIVSLWMVNMGTVAV